MTSILKLNNDLTLMNDNFAMIAESFDSLETLMLEITSKLDDDKWSGKTHIKCIDINELIKQYEKKIRVLVVEFQDAHTKLTKNNEGFCDNSGSVKSLRFW